MRFLVGLLLAVISGGSLSEVVLLEGPEGVLLGALFEDDTEFAPGYSDVGFLVVQPGMSRAQVYRILGKPLRSWGDGPSEAWTQSPTGSSYHCRVIHFRDSYVESKHSEFWLD